MPLPQKNIKLTKRSKNTHFILLWISCGVVIFLTADMARILGSGRSGCSILIVGSPTSLPPKLPKCLSRNVAWSTDHCFCINGRRPQCLLFANSLKLRYFWFFKIFDFGYDIFARFLGDLLYVIFFCFVTILFWCKWCMPCLEILQTNLNIDVGYFFPINKIRQRHVLHR